MMPFDPSSAQLVSAPSGGFDPSSAKLVGGGGAAPATPAPTSRWSHILDYEHSDLTKELAKSPVQQVRDYYNSPQGQEFFQHNLFLNLYHAARNGNLEKFIKNPKLVHAALKDAPSAIKQGISQFFTQAANDPLGAARQLINGVIADPEMLLVGGVEGSLIRRVLVGAAVNGGLGAASEASGELKAAPKLDVAKITEAGTSGATTGGLLGGVLGKGKEVPKEAATETLPPGETLTPPEEQAPAEADIPPEHAQLASDLLDGKIPQKKIDAALKKDPKLLDSIKARVERRRAARAGPEHAKLASDILDGKVSQGRVDAALRKDPKLLDSVKALAERRRAARAGLEQDYLMGPAEGQPRPEPPTVTPRTGSRGAVPLKFEGITPPESPPKSPSGLILPDETTLDRAVAKARSGQGFLLSAEERAALTKSRATGRLQAGSVDPELLKKLGLGAGAATTIAAGLNTLGDWHKRMLGEGGTTLRTLERLPQDKTSFSRAQVEGELRRQDVSAHEKAVVQRALAAIPGDKIPAGELAKQVQLESGQFHLKPVESDDYADYGLDAIDRYTEGMRDPDYEDEEGAMGGEGVKEVQPTTTQYELPFEVPHENHFSNPRMLGWTRSFMENGKRHVVEIQSDLAQKGPTELSPVHRAALEKTLAEEQEYARNTEAWLQKVTNPEAQKSMEFRSKRLHLQDSKLRIAELQKRLAPPPDAATVRNVTSNWPRRLVQEELSRAGKAGQDSVRFATPDTVAKVEGWDEVSPDNIAADEAMLQRIEAMDGNHTMIQALRARIATEKELLKHGRFRPTHQSIYNRYAKEITPYLKQLGGKEVTDEHGHSWIEVPSRQGLPPRQFGGIDPDLVKKLALAGAGGLVLSHFSQDHKFASFLAGAGLASLVGFAAGKVKEGELLKPYSGVRIGPDINRVEAYTAQKEAGTEALIHRLTPMISPDRRAVVRQALEGQKVLLTPTEKEAAGAIRKFYDTYLDEARRAGVMTEGRENYINHLWDFGQNRSRFPAGNLATSTPFAKTRTYSTIEEGKAAGLTPLTEDPLELMRIYSKSMSRAIAGKQLVEGLKSTLDMGGRPLIVAAGKAPKDYVPVNLTALRPYLVHPDIVPSLQMLESPDLGPLSGVAKASQAVKRMKILGSFMHAASLGWSRLMVTGNPLQVGREAISLARGTQEALKQLREEGHGPLVDDALKYGVKVNLRPDETTLEDENNGFYSSMRQLQGYLDQRLPPVAAGVRGFIEANHAIDTITFGKLQTGWKLITFNDTYNRLVKQGLPLDEAGAKAASFTNTMFGTLNWRQMAESASTRLGRTISMAMLHPKSRAMTQMMVFSPDWTMSTIKSWVGAAKTEGGLKDAPREILQGLKNPKTLGDLHRAALIRGAFWFYLFGNAINMAYTGKPMWDNEDPFRVDLGGGDQMQLNKHFTDFPEMVLHPGQEAANKLNMPLQETYDQWFNKQYPSTGGHAPPIVKKGTPKSQAAAERLTHLAKLVLPITGEQSSLADVAASIAGVPIIHHKKHQ